MIPAALKTKAAAYVGAAWLLSLGLLWAFMAGINAAAVKGAREAGRLEAEVDHREASFLALEKAVADASRTQADINRRARDDAAAIAAQLQRLTDTAANASKDLAAYDRAHPLPADCRADAQRMRHVNAGR
jgi:hypothetical protein